MRYSESDYERMFQNHRLNRNTRLKPEDIDATILKQEFFQPSGSTLTICVLTLRNGYSVTGESACADPQNFREEIGKNLAFENARKKIWALEGYLMREILSLRESLESEGRIPISAAAPSVAETSTSSPPTSPVPTPDAPTLEYGELIEENKKKYADLEGKTSISVQPKSGDSDIHREFINQEAAKEMLPTTPEADFSVSVPGSGISGSIATNTGDTSYKMPGLSVEEYEAVMSEGAIAYTAGQQDNPYPPGEKADAWLDGWTESRDESTL